MQYHRCPACVLAVVCFTDRRHLCPWGVGEDKLEVHWEAQGGYMVGPQWAFRVYMETATHRPQLLWPHFTCIPTPI